ncbi:unannotated protein [freshwater metagenome]|uniref:Unannotated protein n=1 Tax=freshwater metagenome TaxID=449393 RepID=A0A6J6DT43_9ZZZZ
MASKDTKNPKPNTTLETPSGSKNTKSRNRNLVRISNQEISVPNTNAIMAATNIFRSEFAAASTKVMFRRSLAPRVPRFTKFSKPKLPRTSKALTRTRTKGIANNPTQIATLITSANKSRRSTFGFRDPSNTCSRPKLSLASLVTTKNARAVIRV